MEYIQAAEKAILHTYNRFPVVFERGEGVYLYDTDGQKYLDFGAGIAVSSLGYSNEEYKEAMKAQFDKLIHTSNLYYSENTAPAAEKLLELSGMERVFFTNSGTEAIEGALKAARKYAYGKESGRYKFIALEHSFHGRSFGALSVTGTESYRTPFEPLVPGVSFGKMNDLESVKALIDDETCGIILEPIQGEGGIFPSQKEFLVGVRALCDAHDLVLIYDEIQCGMGRTGSYFAWQQYDVKPDILVMAKAIGNGFPVGAFGLSEKLATNSLAPGDHGTTYGGNPLALQAVQTVATIFQKSDILTHVKEVGSYLEQSLKALMAQKPIIKEVRGVGLMQGVELKEAPGAYIQKAFEKKLLLIGAGSNTIRFVPPLVIEKEHVDQMIQILKETL
ncbi:acetylornithine/N-succinyldiaminopimelate aminotransferase [Lachnospiraceae bacterium PFB1-21]